jgi:tripartite-type tricarboxylate transporter receptor subunit TctC
MKAVRFIVALCCLAAIVTTAIAEDWPTRPIHIVVPFPAGGSADVQSRMIADELAKALGQPVIVDNKPGAGGNIGAAEAARAQADGYTLFMATTGTHASNVHLYKNLLYDPVKDFAPLTLVTINPQLIVAGKKYESSTFDDFIAALKSGGAATNFGSSGSGSATHLAGELFNRETGAALVHVPYRGQGPALNDLLSGQLDAMFPLVADVFSFVQSGQVHAFAVMGERRAKALPSVPTTAEIGHPRLRISPIWTALYTNAGTPKSIIDRLHHELVRIITARAFVDKVEAIGFEVRTMTPEELATFVASETASWGALINALDVHLD